MNSSFCFVLSVDLIPYNSSLHLILHLIPQFLLSQPQHFSALSTTTTPFPLTFSSSSLDIEGFQLSRFGAMALRRSVSVHLSDVTGVEIACALKNVLAIAAGIVEGMNLGNNSMAALVAQGCSEIRWLAKKGTKNPQLQDCTKFARGSNDAWNCDSGINIRQGILKAETEDDESLSGGARPYPNTACGDGYLMEIASPSSLAFNTPEALRPIFFIWLRFRR